MATNNATIIKSAFLNGTNDYQQRVPDVTTAGVARVAQALFDPMNGDIMNYFASFLINRVGKQRLISKRWNNPISFLKGDNMPFGSTYMESQFKWVKAHGFGMDDVKTETILKTHFPEGLSTFHSVNRRDMYTSSVNEDMLRLAFTEESGLVDFAAGVVDTLYNSDEWDTYNIYKELFAEYHKNHGMFIQNVNQVTDKTTAENLLVELRAYAGILKYPSTIYNAQSVNDLPVFVQPNELMLFTTPRTNAILDVKALAAAYNVDLANFKYRVIELDSMPIPDVDAILTVPDFFVIKDTLYRMTEFYNPESLTLNYYLHHHGINSFSLFTPVIGFSATSSTTIPVINVTVTGMTVTQPAQVVANDVEGAQFLIELEGTVEPAQYDGAIKPRPDSATIQIASIEDASGPIPFSPSDAFTDDYGNLRVFVDHNPALRQAVIDGTAKINLKVKSTYINPSGETQEFTEDIAYTNIVMATGTANDTDDNSSDNTGD